MTAKQTERHSYGVHDLPKGTVTLVAASADGSPAGSTNATAWNAPGGHRRRLVEIATRHEGVVVRVDDGELLLAFGSAREAVAAAAEARAALSGADVRVHIGIHTCEPQPSDHGYTGPDVEAVARLTQLAQAGQVLLTGATRGLVETNTKDLGLHSLAAGAEPQRIHQLQIEGLPSEFPPLAGVEDAAVGETRSGHASRLLGEVVGRVPELAQIDAFAALAESGPAALLLEGEPGIGKTTLWRIALARCREHGLRIIVAAPGEQERALPFAALADLLEADLDQVGDRMTDPQRRALDVALLRAEPGRNRVDQRAVATATLAVLRSLSEQSPLLVAVDDAQWLDAASAQVLEFVARRLRSEHIALALATREVGDEAPLGLARAWFDTRLVRVGVGPLGIDAIGELLGRQLGARPPRPQLEQLHQNSGGNPFFALELGRALQRLPSPPAPGEPLPVPRTLQALLAARLEAIPEDVFELLAVLSLAVRPTVGLAESVLGQDVGQLLEEAERASLVEVATTEVRFAHPLLPAAILASLQGARRRELNKQLAAHAVDVTERAHYLALSTDEPNDQVGDLLEAAAEETAKRGAPAAAADLFEQAGRLTPGADSELRHRRTLKAARAAMESGDLGRSDRLVEDMLHEAPRGDLRAAALNSLANSRYRQAGIEEALELRKRALEEVESTAVRGRIEADFTQNLLQMSRLEPALEHARIAVSLAQELGDPSFLGRTLSDLAMAEFLLGTAPPAELVEHIESLMPQISESSALMTIRLVLAGLKKWSDQGEEALRELRSLRDQAREHRLESHLPGITFQLGELELWLGDWESAATRALEIHRATLAADDAASMLALYLDGAVAAHRGQTEAARAAAERGLETSTRASDLRFSLRHHALLGFIALSSGDTQEASEHLQRARALFHEAGYADPGVVRFQADEVEALIGAGRLEEAAIRATELEASGRQRDRPWPLATGARSRGLVLAAQGRSAEAMEALDEAVAHHARLQQPFEFGRTLLARGAVLRRARQKRSARDSLEQSAAIFDRLGAQLWAARARAEATRIGGRAPAASDLTPTEQRVVELAIEGLTNREIAGQLFMSVKTVERHLSHAYGKLGVRTRRELARKLSSP
jgi:DNA-binding CsgD family transcriptional regulator